MPYPLHYLEKVKEKGIITTNITIISYKVCKMLLEVPITIKNMEGGTNILGYYTSSNLSWYGLPFGKVKTPRDCVNTYLTYCLINYLRYLS